jgi:GDP-D-mannose 3', 5'-epimerase
MSLDKDGRVLVAGAGGFIGGHVVGALLEHGYTSIRAVDLKDTEDWYQRWPGTERVQADLSERTSAEKAVVGCTMVINLAADMGGMGFIENNRTLCMLSALINTHLLMASHDMAVARYFFSSSACVYPAGRQDDPDVTPLAEDDVYPAMPEEGYGWEKLFSERLCQYYLEDFAVPTRVARYHNVYGPHGTWEGGREKAPAAICRKVATAQLTGHKEIEVWGDGTQTRSFTYIDDCTKGTLLLLEGEHDRPLNVGSSELVTVDGLVDLVEAIAGTSLKREYVVDAPRGVRGRNSDNTAIRQIFGWEPSTRLLDGMEATYRWVYDQVAQQLGPA